MCQQQRIVTDRVGVENCEEDCEFSHNGGQRTVNRENKRAVFMCFSALLARKGTASVVSEAWRKCGKKVFYVVELISDESVSWVCGESQ